MSAQHSGTNPHTHASVRLVALSTLRPSLDKPTVLQPLSALQGQLVASTAYLPNRQYASFDLVSTHPSDASLGAAARRVQVRLEGKWAEGAAKKLADGMSSGREVVLEVPREGGARVEVRQLPKKKAGKGGKTDGEREEERETPIAERVRVVFGAGVNGAWRDRETGKRTERFKFEEPTKKKASSASSSRKNADSAASKPASTSSTSTSSSSRPSALTDKTNAHKTPTAAFPLASTASKKPTPHPLAAVPQPAPKAPLDRAALRLLAPSSESALEEPSPSLHRTQPSSREVEGKKRAAAAVEEKREGREGKKAKREKGGEKGGGGGGGTERKKWGLKMDKREYIALDSTPDQNIGGINVVALVITTSAPALSNGGKGDWVTMFQLFDPTCASEGKRLNYFTSKTVSEGELANHSPVVQDGDVVVFQNLNWRKDRTLYSAFGRPDKGQFVVLPSADLLSSAPLSALLSTLKRPTRAALVGDAELSYARDLARWADKHDLLKHALEAMGDLPAVDQTRPVVRSRGRPTQRIEEMQPDQFCDTIGEIVHYSSNFISSAGRCPDSNEFINLRITDYTSNELLPTIEAGEYGGQTVTGQRILQVSIFGKQNEPLLGKGIDPDKLKGRIVRLRNLRPKDGLSGLEATMVEDLVYPDKRDVSLVKNSEVPPDWLQQFLARRKAYWKPEEAGDHLAPIFDSNAGASNSTSPSSVESKPVDPLTEITDLSSLPPAQSVSAAVALNSPGTYRFRVRVVDFYPNKLEEWVVAYCPTCDRNLSTSEDTCIDHDGAVAYEWDFKLALVGEGEVGEHDPVLLTVNSDAANAFLPSFSSTSFASVRSGSLAPLHARLRGILGDILESKKRHRRALDTAKRAEAGPAWDVVLEAVEGEKGEDGKRGKVWWKLDEKRVVFR
ncbi:hypothetical protein JCM8097_001435 [Rhodosporidiobolus ruineniae]